VFNPLLTIRPGAGTSNSSGTAFAVNQTYSGSAVDNNMSREAISRSFEVKLFQATNHDDSAVVANSEGRH